MTFRRRNIRKHNPNHSLSQKGSSCIQGMALTPKKRRISKPTTLSISLFMRSKTTAFRIWTISVLIGIICPLHIVQSVDPKFDPSTRMRLVLVPADAQVGSVIYRLRATDEEFDYPLAFELTGDATSATVKIETLPCTKYNSVCQANVVLQRRLEPGRYYDFQVSVKDTKGGMANQLCSITATNFTTPNDLIFPHKPGIIMIPEDAKRGTELDYVIARKNPLLQQPVYLELWGSQLFAIRQKIVSAETTEGTIFLLGPLDFEKQAMYHLAILANDAYAEPGQDSRNIAGLELVVIVQDVQDQPPVFTSASPVTKLAAGILPGDKGGKLMYIGTIFRPPLSNLVWKQTGFGDVPSSVLFFGERKITLKMAHRRTGLFPNQIGQGRTENRSDIHYYMHCHSILQVHAEDGDKGNPRALRYGLVSEGNPFTSFFDINDTTGEIVLIRPIEDIAAITHIGDPVLLTVIAEEVKVGREEPPAMASTVQLAFFLPERTNSAPYFENDHYVSRIDENAPQGTALPFVDPYVARVYDDDTGKNGVFSLTLLNNNGTFEISPNVAERSTTFLIRVRDNVLLDYEERHSVQFQILAQELGPATNLTVAVNVTVYINDVNDNPPIFDQPSYAVELPENMTAGTKVVQVKASDVDTEDLGGHVRYTAILGYLNTSLNLDAETGLITVSTNNHGFDREIMPEYHLYVEARDNDGTGNRAQVPLILKLIDVNDETPLFESDLYEFILSTDLKSFTTAAIIRATDKDATAPNNEVRYEIINGNYENKFNLDKITGKLSVREKVTLKSKVRGRRQTIAHNNEDILQLTARAYDLGVPVRFSTTTIRIYPPESRTRTVTFLVPGRNPDKLKTEETLSTITGGKVIIHDIRLLQPDEPDAKPVPGGSMDMLERSVVTATVVYDSSSVVDISQIQQRLSQHNSSYAIMNSSDTAETDNLTPLQTLYKAENKLLFWLLILLATLVALTILILLLCCICSWCPLYGAARQKTPLLNVAWTGNVSLGNTSFGSPKRIVNISRTEDDVHLVHREMANGKQAKSVQVAEWMGRREAWSAEKPTDPRTKPTRWEFYNGSEQVHENIGVHAAAKSDEDRRRIHSTEEQKRVKIKNSRTTKDDTFHNSRTNLINDRDVCIEDIADELELLDTATEYFQRSKVNQLQQRNDSELKHTDDDSMRRHEMDRDSDINYNTARSSLKHKREFFIKDGNTEILQLMTRDKTRDDVAGDGDDNNIYVNLPVKSANISQPQLLMVDNSGKEILMRRFIEEQPDGKQIIREHYQIVPGATYIQSMPNEIQQHSILKGDSFALGKSGANSVVYSQTEPEVKVIHTQPIHGAMTVQTGDLVGQMQPSTSNQSLPHELENSLKEQNALLRKILMGKEKIENRYAQQEVVLETQSLPGQSVAIATQTECEVGTQTDENGEFPQKTFVNVQGKYVRRKARSENDDSMSENEYEYLRVSPPNGSEGVYWIKLKNQKKRSKYRYSTHPRKRIVMVEEVKRKIRTPIKEEDDDTFEYRNRSPPIKPLRKHAETKTSVLRRKKNEEMKQKDGAMRQKVPKSGQELAKEMSNSSDDKSRSTGHYQTIWVDELAYYSQKTADDDCDDDSNESDADEIVIKSNVHIPKHSKQKNEGTETKSHNRFEIHLNEKSVDEKFNNATFSRSSSDQRERAAESKPRIPHKVTSQRLHRSQSSSGSPQSRYDIEKHKYSSLNVINAIHRETSEANHVGKDNVYQSETDINYQGDRAVGKDVPKYMEWYYGKQKTANNKATTDSLKSLTPTRKKNSMSEKRLSKKRLYSKPDVYISEEGKSKPEPAPRKSPPKTNRLLKEDIEMNKHHNPKIETETSHPLLQHSEHRFERENATEVPLPPTKLPHYMYPETPPFNASKETLGNNLQVKPKPSPIRENEVKGTNSKISLNVETPNSAHPITSTNSNTQKQLNASTLEDDHDSGIAMNSLLNSMGRRNPIADKKSIFSIAYDDVSRVRKIASAGESPQYS